MQQQFRPPSLNILPPVVKNLLIVNGLFWLFSILLQERFHVDLVHYLGLYYPESPNFKPYQLVTHFFMHAYVDPSGGITFMHIFSNMFSLWMFGTVLEQVWGSKRFLIYYVVTAMGAAILQLGVTAYELAELKGVISSYVANPGYDQFNHVFREIMPRLFDDSGFLEFQAKWAMAKNDPFFINNSVELAKSILDAKINTPTVGASGAVFGVLLAYGMLFPNTLLMLIFFPFPIKAKYFVALYGLGELYLGIANNPGDNVAHFAHLGGMLFGYFMVKYWNKTRRDSFY